MANDPREEIVEYLSALRAFAMSLCRDSATADDLVQETIIKAWSNIDKFDVGTNMRAWLFTILRNTYYSLYRKRSREVADVDGEFTSQLSEKPAHDGRLALLDFSAAFKLLPDEQREALLLVGASGFSYEEAAEMCGCAIGTVKSRANRGRQKLAELMQLGENETPEITDSVNLSVVSNRPAA